MKKIASPDELASELRSILAYAEGEQPSRDKLSSDLRGLAQRVASPPVSRRVTAASEYVGWVEDTAGFMLYFYGPGSRSSVNKKLEEAFQGRDQVETTLSPVDDAYETISLGGARRIQDAWFSKLAPEGRRTLIGFLAEMQDEAERVLWDTDAGRLAKALKKKWRNVSFNPKTGEGSASLGDFQLDFHESGNENAVWLEFKNVTRQKLDSDEAALKMIEAVSKALN